jgi:hypothetical protein
MSERGMDEPILCKSTRYGVGCFHPVSDHTGAGTCCCCSGRHNDPDHAAISHCQMRFEAGVTHQPHHWDGLYDVYHCPGGEPPEPCYMETLDESERRDH